MSWLVDGVLIGLATNSTDHLRQLTDAEIPFVIIDNSSDYVAPFSTVTIDNKMAAYRATEYLIKKDKNILGVFGPQDHIKPNKGLMDLNLAFWIIMSRFQSMILYIMNRGQNSLKIS